MVLQLIAPLAHQLVGKSTRTDAEICRIVRQRVKYLTVRHTPRHHNVSRRVRFREHILDFQAGIDIPLRHIVSFHLLNPLRFQSFSFSDRLHDSEGESLFESFLNQINHNIVSTTDRRLNRRLSAQDKVFRVS